ncbi:uncharacterized protein DS421_10g298720 [Arachis hypogaea]|nr:uncharacterized protein DS421_10g298720 [Arachis hypogaea]
MYQGTNFKGFRKPNAYQEKQFLAATIPIPAAKGVAAMTTTRPRIPAAAAAADQSTRSREDSSCFPLTRPLHSSGLHWRQRRIPTSSQSQTRVLLRIHLSCSTATTTDPFRAAMAARLEAAPFLLFAAALSSTTAVLLEVMEAVTAELAVAESRPGRDAGHGFDGGAPRVRQSVTATKPHLPPSRHSLSSRSDLPSSLLTTAATVAVTPTAPPPSSPLYLVFLLLLFLSFMKKEQKETVRAIAAGFWGEKGS